mgnify:CR=1 FL=1
MSQIKEFTKKIKSNTSLHRSPRGVTSEEWKILYISKKKEFEELIDEYNILLDELNKVRDDNEILKEQFEKSRDDLFVSKWCLSL